MAKYRLSDVGGLRFESKTGRVTGRSTPSPEKDNQRPAMRGPQPPEHHAGHSIETKPTLLSYTNQEGHESLQKWLSESDFNAEKKIRDPASMFQSPGGVF
jgi:hypothetical protein